MSELNEGVQVTFDDATVITVPLVTNLTATNAAPTAKTVGTALATKVDQSDIMEYVRIKVNEEESDNQGQILIDGTGIPISEGSTTSIKDAVDAVDAKTAADIPYSLTESIKAKIDDVAGDVDTVDAKTAADITYDSTAATPVTIKAKVDAVESAANAAGARTGDDIACGATDATKIKTALDTLTAGQVGTVKVTAQTFTDGEKVQARANIGALGTADVADVVRTVAQTFGTDAQQQVRQNIGAVGQNDLTTALNTALGGLLLMAKYTAEVESLAADAKLSLGSSDFGTAAIDGYDIVGIVTATVSGQNIVIMRTVTTDQGGAGVRVWNVGTSAFTGTVSIRVLYAKTGIMTVQS